MVEPLSPVAWLAMVGALVVSALIVGVQNDVISSEPTTQEVTQTTVTE